MLCVCFEQTQVPSWMPTFCNTHILRLSWLVVGLWTKTWEHGAQAHSSHGDPCCSGCVLHLQSLHVRIYSFKNSHAFCSIVIYLICSLIRSIQQLYKRAKSETFSRHYSDTLPFPSLTLCPGFKTGPSLEEHTDIDTARANTFSEAEKTLQNLSSLVIDFEQVLPSRWLLGWLASLSWY